MMEWPNYPIHLGNDLIDDFQEFNWQDLFRFDYYDNIFNQVNDCLARSSGDRW